MRNRGAWVAVGLLCLAAMGGCDGKSGEAPSSIAGTWEFIVLASQCDMIPGVLDNNGGAAAQTFQVTANGLDVSAQFVDSMGSICSLTGRYEGDQFRGQLMVDDQTTPGRVLELVVTGFARIRGGITQVDGFAKVASDSQGLCEGSIVEFCANVFDFGRTDDEIVQDCPPVDIVVIMDTSGSMEDEAAALCDAVSRVEQRLLDLGLERIRTTLLGIVQTPDIVEDGASDGSPPADEFDCLTNTVYRVAGGDGTNHPQVPGDPWPTYTYEDDPGDFVTIKPFELDPGDDESEEFWGPATAIIAQDFDWDTTGELETVKIIIPISDESPQTGRDTCYPVDEAAIANAAKVAWENGVFVSPILGSADGDDRDTCIADLAQTLAVRTGGTFLRTDTTGDESVEDQVVELIYQIVLEACEGRLRTIPEPPDPPPPPAPPPPGEETLIAFDRNGSMYVIDPVEGSIELVLQTNFEGDEPIGVVSSSIFVPARSELWLGTGGNAVCDGCILSLNIFTGEATLLADNGEELDAHPGLAIDSQGNIFGSEGDTSGLFSINNTTGAATRIGSFSGSNNGNGLTFLEGELLVASDDQIIFLDPATGAALDDDDFALVGFSQPELDELNDEGYSVVSMATNAQGGVYGLLQVRGGSGGAGQRRPTYLVVLSEGPSLVKIAQMTVGPPVDPTPVPLDGLAFVPTAFLSEALRED